MATHHTSPQKVRYAVVGLGNIAQVAVLPAFAHAEESSELAALVSSDRDKLRELGDRYGVVRRGSYDELEAILKSAHVDVAYVAVPNTMHRALVERCAAIGVHVLCEKPLAMTVADCEAMIAACRGAGVKLMTAYRLHFEEANLRAVEIARSGVIGEPRFFSACFGQQAREGDIRTRADVGGGALFDMGIYCVNAARYLFRAEPIEVFAFQVVGHDERFKDVDEITSAVLRFSDGRIAQLTASQAAASVDTFRLVGTKGDLRVEPAFTYYGELRHFLTVGDAKTKETSFAKRDQFAAEIVYFARCVLEDVEPEPSGEEGLADVRVMEAIRESARTGRLVTLAPFEREKRPDLSQQIKKPPVKGKPRTVHAPSPSK